MALVVLLVGAVAALAMLGFFLVADGGPFGRGEDADWDEAAVEEDLSAGELADDGHGAARV